MRSTKGPLVTIGLPMFNPGPFLFWSIKSVFAQSYPYWELLILDDASTDDSLPLVQKIRDPRVKIIFDGQNRGLPYRLNQIISLASGELIARMDADDLMHPRRLEKQIEYLLRNPEIDAVTTGAYLVDRNNHPVALWPARQPSAIDVLSWGGYLHPSLVARKNWYQKNPYMETYPRAEDREFFARTLGNAQIKVLEEPLYFYRWYGLVKPNNLLTGYASERRILFRYGPSLIGWGKTALLLARSYMKTGFVYAAKILHVNLENKARFLPLSKEELFKATMALETIAKTEVPGWET